jgi:hypothetical protein
MTSPVACIVVNGGLLYGAMSISAQSCCTVQRSCRSAGANLDVDVPWKYLNFFLDDDAKLQTIGREYGAGRMFTGEVKKELIQVSAGVCSQCLARFVIRSARFGILLVNHLINTMDALAVLMLAQAFRQCVVTTLVSNFLLQVVSDIVQRHQAARARVTDDVVDAFMAVRSMPHLFG